MNNPYQYNVAHYLEVLAMDKIRRVSRLFRYLFQSLMLLPLVLVCSWLWIAPDNAQNLLSIDPLPLRMYSSLFPAEGLDIWQRLLGMAAQVVPAAVDMFLYWQMAVLFGLYAKGEIFTARNVACYRKSAYALLISQAASPFYQAAVSVVLTLNNGEGNRLITIGVDTYDLAKITIAVVILVIAWVMDEARMLKDEEALVI